MFPALIHPAPTPIAIAGVPDYAQAKLYTYSFGPSSDGPVTLNVNYLLWAPLTEEIKCRLAKDDEEGAAKAGLRDVAKDFIDDKLGDAVLYGGTIRENVMRPSVRGRALPGDRRQRQARTARPATPGPL